MTTKTILIVDDEVLIAMDMESTLTEHGHRVLVAADFKTASLMIEEHQIDAAVLDWKLGGVSSGGIAHQLRERNIPFTVCSGSMLSDLPESMRDVPYLEKPFNSARLLATIAGLSSSGRSAEL